MSICLSCKCITQQLEIVTNVDGVHGRHVSIVGAWQARTVVTRRGHEQGVFLKHTTHELRELEDRNPLLRTYGNHAAERLGASSNVFGADEGQEIREGDDRNRVEKYVCIRANRSRFTNCLQNKAVLGEKIHSYRYT